MLGEISCGEGGWEISPLPLLNNLFTAAHDPQADVLPHPLYDACGGANTAHSARVLWNTPEFACFTLIRGKRHIHSVCALPHMILETAQRHTHAHTIMSVRPQQSHLFYGGLACTRVCKTEECRGCDFATTNCTTGSTLRVCVQIEGPIPSGDCNMLMRTCKHVRPPGLCQLMLVPC